MENIVSGDDYTITNQIGAWSKNNGYDGIRAPSARDIGGSNIVVLNP